MKTRRHLTLGYKVETQSGGRNTRNIRIDTDAW